MFWQICKLQTKCPQNSQLSPLCCGVNSISAFKFGHNKDETGRNINKTFQDGTRLNVQIWIHCIRRAISLMHGVPANGLEDQGSIPGRIIPKTQKMVLDAFLLNTQHYKIKIKGKVEPSKEWSSTLLYI